MKHVLITGGGGFLGRKLAERLNSDPSVEKLTLFDQAPIDDPPSKATAVATMCFSSDSSAAWQRARIISPACQQPGRKSACGSGQTG